MHITRGWTGLRTAAIALALGALSATGAQASPTFIDYSTTGTINPTTGVTGQNVVSFQSIHDSTFQTTSNFSLGQFLTAALPAGVSTTYNNTPFQVTFGVQQVNGVTPDPAIQPVTITGTLSGTISGPDQSSVIATFNPITKPIFTDSNGTTYSVNFLNNSVPLVPSTAAGISTAEAQLVAAAAPAPEPTTIAIFAAAIAGIGLRRRLRVRG